MLVVVCPGCARSMNVEENLAGESLPCPRCGSPVVVPSSTLASDPSSLNEGPPTRAIHSADPSSDDEALESLLRPGEADDEIGRLGPFRVLKILGTGGMGVVFLAEDVKLKRKIAVKSMKPEALRDPRAAKRFLREAESMALVEHPHVARIYQVDEDRGIPFLAMELLRGEPLDERLRREQILPVGEVLRIGRQTASGLAAAHALGLVHRDIKPANIWLESPHGSVKILDFGLARTERPEIELTEQGIVVGTPAFMSPEQARGGALDARTDQFSLGVVLYRMATGQIPFHGADAIAVLLAVASEKPTSPRVLNPTLPPDLEAVILKLLEKKPDDRFASMSDAAAALADLEKRLSPAGPRDTVPTPVLGSSASGPRSRLWIGGLALLVVLAVGSAVMWRMMATAESVPPVIVPPVEPKVVEVEKKRFPVEMLTSPDYEWGPAEDLGAAINFSPRTLSPSLTSDERVIVFGGNSKLHLGHRLDSKRPFEKVVRLDDEINRWAGESASLSGDGLMLAFSTDRANLAENDIWMATRPSIDVPFGPPARVPGASSPFAERVPTLSSDGLTLLFTSITPAFSPRKGEIVMLTRETRDEPFGNETVLPAPINTEFYDVSDWISDDRLAVVATRMEKKPFETRLFVRPSINEPFGEPISLDLPYPGNRPWISPDGKHLYYHTRDFPDSNGDLRIFKLTRRRR